MSYRTPEYLKYLEELRIEAEKKKPSIDKCLIGKRKSLDNTKSKRMSLTAVKPSLL